MFFKFDDENKKPSSWHSGHYALTAFIFRSTIMSLYNMSSCSDHFIDAWNEMQSIKVTINSLNFRPLLRKCPQCNSYGYVKLPPSSDFIEAATCYLFAKNLMGQTGYMELSAKDIQSFLFADESWPLTFFFNCEKCDFTEHFQLGKYDESGGAT